MSTVILAEKPSQALAYASALKQSTKKEVMEIRLRSKLKSVLIVHYLKMVLEYK